MGLHHHYALSASSLPIFSVRELFNGSFSTGASQRELLNRSFSYENFPMILKENLLKTFQWEHQNLWQVICDFCRTPARLDVGKISTNFKRSQNSELESPESFWETGQKCRFQLSIYWDDDRFRASQFRTQKRPSGKCKLNALKRID